MNQAKWDIITSNITSNILSQKEIPSLVAESSFVEESIQTPKRLSLLSPNVINVFDSLVGKAAVGDSGVTSYNSIQRQVEYAVSEGAKSLIFYIDSPGGEVSGLFGLANYINSLPRRYGVSTVAITDGMATSAAYVLAAATQKIYSTSTAINGSIGVIMTLVDMTAKDAEAGVKYTILRSKEDKALFNPHEEISKDVLAKAGKLLAKLDTEMNYFVNSFRPKLSIDSIISLKGDDFLGSESVSLNLVDEIVTSIDDVFSLYSSNPGAAKLRNKSTLTGATMLTDNEKELQDKVVELTSEVKTLKAQVSTIASEAKDAEQKRILGILEAVKTFNLDMSLGLKKIKAGTSLEDTLSSFEDIKEALQAHSTVPVEGAQQPTINTATDPNGLSTIQLIDAAFEKVTKSDNLFAGVK